MKGLLLRLKRCAPALRLALVRYAANRTSGFGEVGKAYNEEFRKKAQAVHDAIPDPAARKAHEPVLKEFNSLDHFGQILKAHKGDFDEASNTAASLLYGAKTDNQSALFSGYDYSEGNLSRRFGAFLKYATTPKRRREVPFTTLGSRSPDFEESFVGNLQDPTQETEKGTGRTPRVRPTRNREYLGKSWEAPLPKGSSLESKILKQVGQYGTEGAHSRIMEAFRSELKKGNNAGAVRSEIDRMVREGKLVVVRTRPPGGGKTFDKYYLPEHAPSSPPPPSRGEVHKSKIKELLGSGASLQAISRELGISRQRVSQLIAEMPPEDRAGYAPKTVRKPGKLRRRFAKVDGHQDAHPLVAGFPIEHALRNLANNPANPPSVRDLSRLALTGRNLEGKAVHPSSALWALHDALRDEGHPAADWYNWLSAADALDTDHAVHRAMAGAAADHAMVLRLPSGHPKAAPEYTAYRAGSLHTPLPGEEPKERLKQRLLLNARVFAPGLDHAGLEKSLARHRVRARYLFAKDNNVRPLKEILEGEAYAPLGPKGAGGHKWVDDKAARYRRVQELLRRRYAARSEMNGRSYVWHNNPNLLKLVLMDMRDGHAVPPQNGDRVQLIRYRPRRLASYSPGSPRPDWHWRSEHTHPEYSGRYMGRLFAPGDSVVYDEAKHGKLERLSSMSGSVLGNQDAVEYDHHRNEKGADQGDFDAADEPGHFRRRFVKSVKYAVTSNRGKGEYADTLIWHNNPHLFLDKAENKGSPGRFVGVTRYRPAKSKKYPEDGWMWEAEEQHPHYAHLYHGVHESSHVHGDIYDPDKHDKMMFPDFLPPDIENQRAVDYDHARNAPGANEDDFPAAQEPDHFRRRYGKPRPFRPGQVISVRGYSPDRHFFPEEKEALVGGKPASQRAFVVKAGTGLEGNIPKSTVGTPELDEVKALATLGEPVRGMYADAHRQVEHLFRDPHSANLFSGANAILSANTAWERHTKAALEAVSRWHAEGRPTDRETLDRIFGTTRKVTKTDLKTGKTQVTTVGNDDGEMNGYGALYGDKIDKLKNLFASAHDGEYPELLWEHVTEGGAFKTPNFGMAHVDPRGSPTDTHMGKLGVYGYYPRKWDARAGRYKPAVDMTRTGLERMAASGLIPTDVSQRMKEIRDKLVATAPVHLAFKTLVSKAADDLGWEPREVQEAVWVALLGVMTAKHLGASSKSSSIIEHLTNHALQRGWSLSTILEDPDVHADLKRAGIPIQRVRAVLSQAAKRRPNRPGRPTTGDASALESVALRLPPGVPAAASPINEALKKSRSRHYSLAVRGDFIDSLRRIRSSNQQTLRRVALDVSRRLGLHPTVVLPGLHDTRRGSVPGVIQAVYGNATPEQIHTAASWIGLTGNLPGTAVFHPRESGPDYLHKFRQVGAGLDIRDKLDRAGISDRVIAIPEGDPTRVGFDILVPDSGGRLRGAVQNYASLHGLKLQSSRGHFKTVGSQDQASARDQYRNTVVKGEESAARQGPARMRRQTLTPSQVARIRKVKDQMTQTELSKMYGVSQAQISRIESGKRWPKGKSKKKRDSSPRRYAEAGHSDIEGLLNQISRNAGKDTPSSNTLHLALADALEEVHGEHPLASLIRRQFGGTPEAPPQNLWYDPPVNLLGGHAPGWEAPLGNWGPFDFYLAHEGHPSGSPSTTGDDNQRWIVHATSNLPSSYGLGYSFEFPHSRAHLIPRMFPAAGEHINSMEIHPENRVGTAYVGDTESGAEFRNREARTFSDRFDGRAE